MVRRQINLDPRDYELVKAEARALGVSVAQIVRAAVRQSLSTHSTAPWMRFAGMVESGNPRSSETVDEVVNSPEGRNR